VVPVSFVLYAIGSPNAYHSEIENEEEMENLGKNTKKSPNPFEMNWIVSKMNCRQLSEFFHRMVP
jgi:hypothetical protein